MQFVQPDTIIPNSNNPQALNRYAYVLRNPIRFNDPSGHDPIDCDHVPSQYRSQCKAANTRQIPVTNQEFSNREIINRGTVYSSVNVTLSEDAEAMNLSVKAEENYSGLGIDPDTWWTFSLDVVGIINDLSPQVITPYQLYMELDWLQDNSGLLVESLVIKNNSPTVASVRQVVLDSPINTSVITVPNQAAYENESIAINIYSRVDPWVPTAISVKLYIVGSQFPGFVYSYRIPPGLIPNGGCSFPRHNP